MGIPMRRHVYSWTPSLNPICIPWLMSPSTWVHNIVERRIESHAAMIKLRFFPPFCVSTFVGYTVWEFLHSTDSNLQRHSWCLLISDSFDGFRWVFQASRLSFFRHWCNTRVFCARGFEAVKEKRGMQLSLLYARQTPQFYHHNVHMSYVGLGLQSFLSRQYCRMGTFLSVIFPNRHFLEFYSMEIDLWATLLWVVTAHFINSYTVAPILFLFSISNGSLCLISYLSFVLQNLQRSNGLLCLLKMHRLVLKNFSVKRVWGWIWIFNRVKGIQMVLISLRLVSLVNFFKFKVWIWLDLEK